MDRMRSGPTRDELAAWDPWAAAEARPGLVVVEEALEGRRGVWQRDRLGDLIAIDVGLDPAERRAVLTHELVHAERGIGWGRATAATMAKEEWIVRGETATRLVPARSLGRFIADRGGAGVRPEDVEEHFDVPRDVAIIALENFSRHGVDEGLRRS